MLYVSLTLVNVQLVVCIPLPPAAHSEMLLPSSYSWPPCCFSEGKRKKHLTKEGMFQLYLSFVVCNLHLFCDCRDLGQGILGESKFSLFFF